LELGCGVDLGSVPADFGIGVVFGSTGSGKTVRLQELVKQLGLEAMPEPPQFAAKEPVASHKGFDGDAVDRLSCVGLNKIPSWCRPFHYLSNGEQSRVRAALSLNHGAILDNFAAVVDETNAKSMATWLAKFVAKRGFRKVLISTTKACVLAHLQPDFVVFASSGVVRLNPHPMSERRHHIEWKWLLTEFVTKAKVSDNGLAGWIGEEDSQQGKPRTSLVQKWPKAVRPLDLTCTVNPNEVCAEALIAFDYEFTGESTSKVWVLDEKALPTYKLGAVVGPSGSGKSTCLGLLVQGGPLSDSRPWDAEKAVISQICCGSPDDAHALCRAAALPLNVALRPYQVLSEGEQHRAELARQLGSAAYGALEKIAIPVCLDEFTSVLDRSLAKKVCESLSHYLHSRAFRPIVVATVHQDIAEWLRADWILDSKTGVLSTPPLASGEADAQGTASGTRTLVRYLSQTDGKDDEAWTQLLRPPVLKLEVRRLGAHQASIEVFKETFEEHHYMRGNVPHCFWGVVAREAGTKQPVAFHAIANFPGVGNGGITLRESRLVVLPQFQGFGIGPAFSEGIGDILLSSGKRFFSVTHHPRLGKQRDVSSRWKGTTGNHKGAMHLGGGRSERAAYRHQYRGIEGHGNDLLAKAASAGSVGLKKRPGIIVCVPTSKMHTKTAARIAKFEGKSVAQVFDDIPRGASSSNFRRETRKFINLCMENGHIRLDNSAEDSDATGDQRLSSVAELGADDGPFRSSSSRGSSSISNAAAGHLSCGGRRMHLTRALVAKYGHTAGCPGCAALGAATVQSKGPPAPHSDACWQCLQAAVHDAAAQLVIRETDSKDSIENNPPVRGDLQHGEEESTPAAEGRVPVVDGIAHVAGIAMLTPPVKDDDEGGLATASDGHMQPPIETTALCTPKRKHSRADIDDLGGVASERKEKSDEDWASLCGKRARQIADVYLEFDGKPESNPDPEPSAGTEPVVQLAPSSSDANCTSPVKCGDELMSTLAECYAALEASTPLR